MQTYGYLWGNFEPETQPVVTVALTGFDDLPNRMTGRRDVLWRTFFNGAGGGAPHAQLAGFALWAPSGKE